MKKQHASGKLQAADETTAQVLVAESNPNCDQAVIEGLRPRILKRAVLALLLATPALWTGYLIYLYGVDFPYMDHWDFVCGILEKADEGTLRFTDFTLQFGPHRMFFQKVLLFGLAKLTEWNVRAELLLTWLVACACAANLWRLAAVTDVNPRREGYWLIWGACVLLFTPMQLEIWFSGMEMQYALAVMCLTACLWIIPAVQFPINVLLAAVLCMIGTFTVASGLVCWILIFPVLWFHSACLSKRQKLACQVFWGFAFLICLLLYFHDYDAAATDSGLTQFASHPVQALRYFLIYVGGGFRRGTAFSGENIGQIVGVALFLILATLISHLWRWRRDKELLARSLPWLALALFALCNAALTTVGRLDLGVRSALAPRYLATAILLPISLLFLVPTIFKHWRAHTNDLAKAANARRVLIGIVTALALLHAMSSIKRLEDWRQVQHERLAAKALLLLCNVVDDDETLLQITGMNQPGRTNEPALTKNHVKFLDRIGYLRPPVVWTNAIREIIGATTRTPGQFGEIQRVVRLAKGQFRLAGWAVLPDKCRVADAVLLTYDDLKRGPIIFAAAVVDTSRIDLANPSRQPGFLLRSGWGKTFNIRRLPATDRLVRAWAFDAEDGRAYVMSGSATVSDVQASPDS